MQEQRPKTPEVAEAPRSEFVGKLEKRWEKGNFVCVGLDSDYSQIPRAVYDSIKWPHQVGVNVTSETIAKFNEEIVDATCDLVCAYKPNIAFYEAYGESGILGLKHSIEYIKRTYPDIPVILDAKRADIGNTNLGYVKAAFDELGADAVTVSPYLGKEALKPFLGRKDKGIIPIIKTSNPGSGEFQDLPINLKDIGLVYEDEFETDDEDLRRISGTFKVPLYQYAAFRVSRYWNDNGNVAIVVGATYPEELGMVRKIVGDIPILIPGIGAQGGEMEATVEAGQDSRGMGMIINSSRGIIFASKGEDFAEVARRETQRLREEINKYRYAA